jgi:23S rRNA A1618 N6-methylase RlmF
LGSGERFHFCMCNPPFFESLAEANRNPNTACGGERRGGAVGRGWVERRGDVGKGREAEGGGGAGECGATRNVLRWREQSGERVEDMDEEPGPDMRNVV